MLTLRDSRFHKGPRKLRENTNLPRLTVATALEPGKDFKYLQVPSLSMEGVGVARAKRNTEGQRTGITAEEWN